MVRLCWTRLKYFFHDRSFVAVYAAAMRTFFWRQGSFNALKDLRETLAQNANYRLLAESVELREKGLRKESLRRLSEFIVTFSSSPFTERQEFVSMLCGKRFQWGSDGFLLDPQPLVEQVIKPTLSEWITIDPDNPDPYKWLGLYYGADNELTYLEKALALDPEDDVIRFRLIDIQLGVIEFSTHHLDEGLYLGDPQKDIAVCAELLSQALKISHSDAKDPLQSEIETYKSMIEDWITFSSQSKSISFPDFCTQLGRKYSWSLKHYYSNDHVISCPPKLNQINSLGRILPKDEMTEVLQSFLSRIGNHLNPEISTSAPIACRIRATISSPKLLNDWLITSVPLFAYFENYNIMVQASAQSLIGFIELREPWQDYDICIFDENFKWCAALTHNNEAKFIFIS